MRSYPSWIAGLDYRGPDGTNRAKYCAGLAIGTALALRSEPNNTHDENAVAIHHGGHHLGYVPRRHSWVGNAIKEGKNLSCEIIEVELAKSVLGKRAEHVETRIAVLSQDPPVDTERAAILKARRERKLLEDKARKCCADGLRVLAYLALVDGRRSPEERNIELSVIESRLIISGFNRDPDILAMLGEQAVALAVTKNAMTRSVNALAKDESYFRLVYDAVRLIAGLDGEQDTGESEVVGRLVKAGKANGWI